MVLCGREWTNMDNTPPLKGGFPALSRGVWTAMDAYALGFGGAGGSHTKAQIARFSVTFRTSYADCPCSIPWTENLHGSCVSIADRAPRTHTMLDGTARSK